MARKPRVPRVRIDYIGGACPQQAHGRIGALAFYVRERHGETSVVLGPPDPGEPCGVKGNWWVYADELDPPRVRRAVREAYAQYQASQRARRRR